MIRIWRKSELEFALLWIAIYLAGNSLTAGLSGMLGMKNCFEAVFHLGTSLLLFFWLRKNGLLERYGLRKTELPAGRLLWYVPLMVLASKNLWNGIIAPPAIADAMFGVCSMAGVGFLEELLFRALLFRAVSRNGVRLAAVISSVSFGLGHIANLFNGRGMGLAETMWQIIFATAFGFLCVVIFYRGKTLWPCVLTHAAFNAASVFAGEAERTVPAQALQDAAILLLVAGYARFLMRTLPEGDAGGFPTETE